MARRTGRKPPTSRPPRRARSGRSRSRSGSRPRAAPPPILIAKGYRIVARRWRSPVGEIDIVARRRGTLVFVEVKARERLDDAAEAVIVRQQRRIIAAAEAWLAAHPDDVELRHALRRGAGRAEEPSAPHHGGVRREQLITPPSACGPRADPAR